MCVLGPLLAGKQCWHVKQEPYGAALMHASAADVEPRATQSQHCGRSASCSQQQAAAPNSLTVSAIITDRVSTKGNEFIRVRPSVRLNA